jgi:uncharacterized protein YfaT (DUF1175 family)
MVSHPNPKDFLPPCPGCAPKPVSNCTCLGTGFHMSTPEVVPSTHRDHKRAWYVRSHPVGFKEGPGSRYLCRDGVWRAGATEGKRGKSGYFLSQAAAQHALELACE